MYRDSTTIQERELAIRLESEPDTTIVSLYGELDLTSAQTLETTLVGLGRDGGSIIVDLSGLEFIDSTGLAVLLRAVTRSRQDSDHLALLRGREQVQRVLQVTGLEDQLPFLD